MDPEEGGLKPMDRGIKRIAFFAGPKNGNPFIGIFQALLFMSGLGNLRFEPKPVGPEGP